VLVADLDRASGLYETFLGNPGEEITATDNDISRARRFKIGPHWIDLAEPKPDAGELHEAIHQRGIAPYRLVLAATGGEWASLPGPESHGARIEVR
jgi:hypothetical protein